MAERVELRYFTDAMAEVDYESGIQHYLSLSPQEWEDLAAICEFYAKPTRRAIGATLEENTSRRLELGRRIKELAS